MFTNGDLGSGNHKEDLGGCHFHSISFNNLQAWEIKIKKEKILSFNLVEIIRVNLLLIYLNKNYIILI